MNILKLPLNQSVSILNYNKHGLVALEKGVGVLSHPNRGNDKKPALIDAKYDFNEESYTWKDDEGNDEKAWLLNRLDSPTSGVILLALNETIRNAIRVAFEKHTVKKIYYAIVKGCPRNTSGQWNQKLKPSSYASKHKAPARLAKTLYRVDARSPSNSQLTCLRLEPVTGRTHQLRIHCSDNRLPIIGDQTYGDFKFNRQIKQSLGIDRLCLHSESTSVSYQYNGRRHEFKAKSKLPESFSALIK